VFFSKVLVSEVRTSDTSYAIERMLCLFSLEFWSFRKIASSNRAPFSEKAQFSANQSARIDLTI